MPRNVAAARANGLADTNFAGPLGNTDQHNVHDADAANEQADRTDNEGGDGHHAENVVKFLDLHFGGLDGKVVFSAVGHITAALQDVPRLVYGLAKHAGICLHAHVNFIGGRIHFAKGVEGNEDALVPISHAESALGFFHHADDLEI